MTRAITPYLQSFGDQLKWTSDAPRIGMLALPVLTPGKTLVMHAFPRGSSTPDAGWHQIIPDDTDDIRWYQMILDDTRWYQTIPDDTRWYQVMDDAGWCRMRPDDTRMLDDAGWYQMILDDRYQMILDDARWYQIIPDDPACFSGMNFN